MNRKILNILGVTGSIGQNTLDIVRKYKDKFQLRMITASCNKVEITKICQEFSPEYVYLADVSAAKELALEFEQASLKTIVIDSKQTMLELLAEEHDITISAIAGIAALEPTMHAISGAKLLGLANKESIVCAGRFVLDHARKHDCKIIPMDSEHNALYQILDGKYNLGVLDYQNSNQQSQSHSSWQKNEVMECIITASGGPFLGMQRADFENMGPKQAIKHPTWSMGAKISVDSASMMNKGLEFIEACELFALPAERVRIVVHPQSFIHGIVSFCDGTSIAQMNPPDMRVPIAHALGYPQRLEMGVSKLDFAKWRSLEFIELDDQNFPLPRIAIEAYQSGDLSRMVILNVSNEIAVKKFLEGQISFGKMIDFVIGAEQNHQSANLNSYEDVVSYTAELFAKSK